MKKIKIRGTEALFFEMSSKDKKEFQSYIIKSRVPAVTYTVVHRSNDWGTPFMIRAGVFSGSVNRLGVIIGELDTSLVNKILTRRWHRDIIEAIMGTE